VPATGVDAASREPGETKLHGLRHHYPSVLIDGGESLRVVQARLGHASAVATLPAHSRLTPSSDERTRTVVEVRVDGAPVDQLRTPGTYPL
jgi:site-specific recombinase XerD